MDQNMSNTKRHITYKMAVNLRYLSANINNEDEKMEI